MQTETPTARDTRTERQGDRCADKLRERHEEDTSAHAPEREKKRGAAFWCGCVCVFVRLFSAAGSSPRESLNGSNSRHKYTQRSAASHVMDSSPLLPPGSSPFVEAKPGSILGSLCKSRSPPRRAAEAKPRPGCYVVLGEQRETLREQTET